jgi:hypothetical protein
MSHGEIIAKAVKKALENGWQLPFEEPVESYALVQPDQFHTKDEYNIAPYIRFKFAGGGVYETGVMYTIFNREFARALWGEAPIAFNAEYKIMQMDSELSEYTVWHSSLPAWQFHLQQMVIADDPIEYLGKNL